MKRRRHVGITAFNREGVAPICVGVCNRTDFEPANMQPPHSSDTIRWAFQILSVRNILRLPGVLRAHSIFTTESVSARADGRQPRSNR